MFSWIKSKFSVLDRLLASENDAGEARKRAASSRETLGDLNAVPVLLQRLKDPRERLEVQHAAATALLLLIKNRLSRDGSTLVRCSAKVSGECFAIHPRGSIFATKRPVVRGDSEKDGIVWLWGFPDGKLLKTLGQDRGRFYPVENYSDDDLRNMPHHAALVFSPSGNFLANANGECVQIWSIPSGQQTILPRSEMYCIVFSDDEESLTTSNRFETVIWELPTGRMLRSEIVDKPFSTDGDRCHRDKRSGKKLVEFPNRVLSSAVSPDGKILATGSYTREGSPPKKLPFPGLNLWTIDNGTLLKAIGGYDNSCPRCLAFSPDGKILACGGVNNIGLHVWTIPDGQLLKTLIADKYDAASVHAIAFSPKGHLLAAGMGDGIWLWAIPSGKLLRKLQGYNGFVSSVEFSQDNQFLVSRESGDMVHVWSFELDRLSRTPLHELAPSDLHWTEEALQKPNLSATERRCLKLLLAVLRWRKHCDGKPAS